MKSFSVSRKWPECLLQISFFTLVMATVVPVAAWSGEQTDVPYPEGFRYWLHVKSDLVTKDHPRFESIGGYLHIYANQIALTGYRTGTFPEGSVLVADILEAQPKVGLVAEGPRRWIGVMHKDSEKFKNTGGWGFENFSGDSKTDRHVSVNPPLENCYACHSQRKDSDYVFSKLRN